MNLQITNTLSGKKENFIPIKKDEVSIYVCGVTLYDEIHIGHLKSILSFEVMRNYFKANGMKVTYVRNITDVDDKIINKAIRENKDPLDLVNGYIDKFHKLLKTLEINPPDIEPRVTSSLEQITRFIKNLQGKGYAYETQDGIYFDTEKLNVQTYPLSKKVVKDMEDFSRIGNDTYDRKNKADFALWKQDDNYGYKSNIFNKPGRPGWHIECSAMHYEALGEKFDIHGGGRDLIFPHHENEISQSFAHNGVSPANYWVHNGMMTKDHKKLSKSLGNSIYVQNIIDKFSPQGLKIFLLKAHYALAHEFSEVELAEAHQRWITFATDIPSYKSTGDKPDVYSKVMQALDDDFNTPIVISLLYQAMKQTQATKSLEYANEVFKILKLLSIVANSKELKDYEIKETAPQEILEAMDERWNLKLSKKWKEADEIRKQILEKGWVIKDNSDGYTYSKFVDFSKN